MLSVEIVADYCTMLMCLCEENLTDMVVTWVTMQSTIETVVEYGVDDLNKTAKGLEDAFTDGGTEKRMIFIHRVTITGLRPGQKYSEY